MKIAIIQPEYSTKSECSAKLFDTEIRLLDSCDESLDIIVMPEYSDIPAMPDSNETFWESVEKFHSSLLAKASETAKRCQAFVFVNGIGDKKNTTFAFNRKGELFGKYFKRHLTAGEAKGRGLLHDYALRTAEPYIIETEGIRFAFLTCYDFYFYEAFGAIARENVDIIIGCSHQRSDSHDTSELFSRFAAYNCNAYLLRSSVSMGKDSDIGGASMVVSPKGEVLLNMKNRVGLETVEIDPKDKYYKPAGFGNAPSAHYEYVEKGRCPWNYRPGGSAIALPDSIMPYPRLCVKPSSGLSRDEILAYFGGAIALDINEVSSEITSGNREELFSETLRKFSCHAVMNIRIEDDDRDFIERAVSLIKRYDCEKYVYFSSKNEDILKFLNKKYPKFPTCYCAANGNIDSVSIAQSLSCKKIQFKEADMSSENIALAHENGLICNVLIDNEAAGRKLLDMGADTIITEDYASFLPLFKNR